MLIRKWEWKNYNANSGMVKILKRSLCDIIHICHPITESHGVG